MSWFIRPRALTAPRMRLFCFPYAGAGGQIFSSWARLLPADVDLCAVQPPGRWTRRAEAPFNRTGPMVAACLEAMTPLLHTPFVLFGHSLGALLAYEISRIAEPRHLIVSARRIPSAPLGRAPISALPDAEFLAEIDRVYGGVPAAVLKEHDLMEMLLPALRADMQAYEHYTCAADSTPLACPITAFYGTADKTCGAEDAARWRSFTTGQFVLTEFVGPHLFLQTRQAEVLANITRILMR